MARGVDSWSSWMSLGCVIGNAVANAERLMLQIKFEKLETVVNVRFGKEPIEQLRHLKVPAAVSPSKTCRS